MEIRTATPADWPLIWPFLREIVAAGETYTWPRDVPEERARELWMPGPPARTVVAVAPDGTVLGSAKLAPNQAGPGDHVANASFMVAPAAAGRGVGRALAAYVLDAARTLVRLAAEESKTLALLEQSRAAAGVEPERSPASVDAARAATGVEPEHSPTAVDPLL